MVQCENPECREGQWFHLSCVGLRSVPGKKDAFFCSDRCRSEMDDHMRTYMKSLLWALLNYAADKDAIRADGGRIVRSWKRNMISFFFRHNRKNYLEMGRRFLTAANGCAPP